MQVSASVKQLPASYQPSPTTHFSSITRRDFTTALLGLSLWPSDKANAQEKKKQPQQSPLGDIEYELPDFGTSPDGDIFITTTQRYKLKQNKSNPDMVDITTSYGAPLASFYKSGAGIFNKCKELIARAEGNKAYAFPPGRFDSGEPEYIVHKDGSIQGPFGFEKVKATFPKTMTFEGKTVPFTPTLQAAATAAILAPCRPEPGKFDRIVEEFLNRNK